MVEQMDRVSLSVTIRGAASEIHGASAYHCTNWQIFTVIAPLGSVRPNINRWCRHPV